MFLNSSKYKVKRKYPDDIEPEEIFLDSRRLKESPEGEKEKIEKPIKEKILKLFLILIFLIIGLLTIESFRLQIIKGGYWQGLSDENRIRSYPLRPLRGIIYDRNKKPLAINIPKLDLMIVPGDLVENKNLDQIVERLSQILEKPKDELEKKIGENASLFYPIIIEENISREKALLLEPIISDIPEIDIFKNSLRQYEGGEIFAHILGYLGKANPEEILNSKYLFDDYIGRTGIEETYEGQLRGFRGEELMEVNSLGKVQKVLAIKEPEPGKDIILSIDRDLQEKIYNTLKSKLATLSTSRAAAVAINPQNGKVLALISLPSFNNNDFIKGLSSELFDKLFNNKNEPLFNRVISGQYPPGSTIKPIIASAGLVEGVISSNKTIDCPGYLTLTDAYNSNIVWTKNDWKAHGAVNLNKAIAESCDVYFYILGGGYKDIEGLGIEKMEKYLKLFGLGQTSGIDLTGEKSGFIPNPTWKNEIKKEKWYIGDTYNVSIGQGDILVSPLQIAMETSVIANKGTLFRPQLINENKAEVLREKIITKEILDVVRKGMREAVISGSARYLADLPVEAAGKTGTAEVAKNKTPHGWFTVFAPYENPEIVLTILIENGGEGSSVAVPIAKEILSWYFNR